MLIETMDEALDVVEHLVRKVRVAIFEEAVQEHQDVAEAEDSALAGQRQQDLAVGEPPAARDPDPDAVATPPLFMAFDLLYHDHRALTGRPLRDRRARLGDVVGAEPQGSQGAGNSSVTAVAELEETRADDEADPVR